MKEALEMWMTEPGWFLYFSVIIFFFGACWGSFLNVCIYRIPMELSVVHPPSHCFACKNRIAWYDNIPIVSWLVLRGRCRKCSARISPRYMLVELLVAILFLLVWYYYRVDPRTPVFWIMICGLVLGTFVDFDHMWIPDRVTWGGILAGLGLSALVPSLHGMETPLRGFLASASGAAIGFGLLWAVAGIGKMIFRKDAMGFGDVKLLGAIGAFLGWQAVLFTVMASSFLGSIIGVSLIVSGNKEWQSRIPFGPYLSLGALVWILWGSAWWQAYVNWVAGAYTY